MTRKMLTGILLLLGVLALLGGILLLPGAMAADNPALLNFDPREQTADPGETITVDVLLQASSHFEDDGVYWYNYTVEYNGSIMEATSVEIGPWMEQGDDTTVRSNTSIDATNGTVYVEQERDPPAGGVNDVGDTVTATITLTIDEDAPPRTTALEFSAAHAQLLEYPLPVLTTRESVVLIDGGGDTEAETRESSPDDRPGVILADEPPEESANTGINRAVAGGIAASLSLLVASVAGIARYDRRRQN